MSVLEVNFTDVSAADAARLAADLVEVIETGFPGTQAKVLGGAKDNMDFGATVGVIVGAAATGSLAKGIADWIRRQGDPALVLKTKKGELTVKSGLDLSVKREIIMKALEGGVL